LRNFHSVVVAALLVVQQGHALEWRKGAFELLLLGRLQCFDKVPLFALSHLKAVFACGLLVKHPDPGSVTGQEVLAGGERTC